MKGTLPARESGEWRVRGAHAVGVASVSAPEGKVEKERSGLEPMVARGVLEEEEALKEATEFWNLGGLFSWVQEKVRDLPFWARELIRKTLHIGVVVLAVPLHWFGWWYGLLFAGAALVWNAFGMPRFFRFTFREDEEKVGYSVGMLSYPVTVFMLMIVFPLPIAASQWATLSFGDGFATLVGRFLGKRTLPWNREKTVMGFLGFILMGTVGSMIFFWLTLPNAGASSFLWVGSPLLAHLPAMSLGQIIIICAVSTVAAGFFESLPIPHVDDNVAAPLAGALVKLGLCYLL